MRGHDPHPNVCDPCVSSARLVGILTVRARRSIGGLSRRLRAGLMVLLAALVAGPVARAQESQLELAVKATYLYKFAPFVEWPASAFDSPTAPLVLCVVGDDPFGDLLDRAVSGQHAGKHPIALRRLST